MSRNFIILPSMKLTIAKLAEILKGKVVGEDNTQLFKLSKIEDAQKGDITFVSNPRYLPWLYKTKASVVIVDSNLEYDNKKVGNIILVDNAYSSFNELLNRFAQNKLKHTGIHKNCSIDSTVELGNNVSVGQFSSIGQNCKIGDNVIIMDNVPIQWEKQNDLSNRKLDFENMFKVNKDSTYNFKFPGAKVSIEKNSFYTDKIIQIFEENNLLHVDKDSIPLLKGIAIKMDVSRYNDSIRNRTYIGRIGENKKSSFVSSKKEENYVIAKVNNLGDFVIKIDSIKPNISVIDISDNQWISNRKNLTIKISDNESGVKNYRGTINDKWILLEYNPMKGILTYDFNDNVNRDDAKNVLEIKIEDNVGNEKKLIKTFYRKIK